MILTTKIVICLLLILVVCFSVTGITFYDEYKYNKKLPKDDSEKESNFSLFVQCLTSALMFTFFIAVPTLILMFLIFPND